MSYDPTIRENYELSKDPSGFANRTDSTLTFDNATRTFTIAPVSDHYEIFLQGVLHRKYTPSSVAIDDTEGLWYIYFNTAGNLVATQTFSVTFFTDLAIVSLLYWDADNDTAIYVADERHGFKMDGATQAYLHNSVGAAYISGFSLGNFTFNAGNAAADAQFSVSPGTFYDEDIVHSVVDGSPQTLSPAALLPVFYREGATGVWRKKTATAFPVITATDAGLDGGRLAYNQWTGVTWQQTIVDNNSFTLIHVFATNNISEPVIAVQGDNQYGNIPAARAAAPTEISTLSGLPFVEAVPLGSVIYQTADGYTNAVKARVRQTDTGSAYVDLRQISTLPVNQVNDHGNLSGLTDLDHPATAIRVDATNFNGNLSAADTTVQAALQTLDDLSIAAGVTSVGLHMGSTALTVSTDGGATFGQSGTITSSGTFRLGGVLTPAHGGTGLTSYSAGDLVYASSSSALTTLAGAGGTGQVLLSGVAAPSWGKVNLTSATHITGVLPATNGGTGRAAWTTGDLIYSDATNSLNRRGIGTTNQALIVSGGVPTWGSVALTAGAGGVTGTLPVANGGTGTSISFTQGSVIFAGASGVYSQDASPVQALTWATTGKRLLINSSGSAVTATTNLDVRGTAQVRAVTDGLAFLVRTSGDSSVFSVNTSTTQVGINTSGPSATLDVRGTLNVQNTSVNSTTAYQFKRLPSDSGTALGTQTSTTLADTSKSWTTNQWASGIVTLTGGPGAGQTISVASNTANTLTLIQPWPTTTPASGSTTYTVTAAAINAEPLLNIDTANARVSVGPSSQFQVDSTGNIVAIRGVTTTFPSANASGVLTNNGSGTLSWATVGVANGGTNLSSYTIGDIIYASGTTTLSKLADVITGNALISGGVGAAPSWGKIGIGSHVSGLGTSVATALAVNVGSAGAVVVNGGALGTPSSGTLTNATGLPIDAGTAGTLPVTRGGTGASTAFTAGSIVFAGASGVYTQDNANLFWDDGGNRLGLGTPTPTKRLEVAGDDAIIYGVTIGRGAGANSSNTAIGSSALAANTTGGNNTALGSNAAIAVTTGQNNVVVGALAGMFLSTGGNNTVVGSGATLVSSATYNVAVGSAAGSPTSGAVYGVAVGYLANLGFTGNVAVGYYANAAGNTSTYNVAIGYEAARSMIGGANNVMLGYRAGYSINDGADNIAIGANAGYANLDGINNVALGTSALTAATGSSNVAVGTSAIQATTAVSGLTAVGFEALRNNTLGTQNTAVGFGAGRATSSGSANTYVGHSAGNVGTVSSYNTALGVDALKNNTGSRSTAVGYGALIATGDDCVAVGYNALGLAGGSTAECVVVGAEAGLNNAAAGVVAVGYRALRNNTGANNTAVGWSALLNNTSGTRNTAVGNSALISLAAPVSGTDSTDNTTVGYGAGDAVTLGARNTALGSGALGAMTVGDEGTGIGAYALRNATGFGNVAVGSYSGDNITTGQRNVVMGVNALGVTGSAALMSGTDNVAVGYAALGHTSASATANVGVGRLAGDSCTGSDNVFIGIEAGNTITSGSSNVVVGGYAGGGTSGNSNNTSIGAYAGSTITTGFNLTCIGYNAEPAAPTSTNQVIIGDANVTNFRIGVPDQSSAGGSGFSVGGITGQTSVSLGHASQTAGADFISFYANGTYVGRIEQSNPVGGIVLVSVSDYRLKQDVQDIANPLEKLRALKPCTYRFKADPTETTTDGFVAHELQAVVPSAVSGVKDAVAADGALVPQGVDMTRLIPVLTAAMKNMLSKIDALESELAALKQTR